jgi:hypothetical protein
LREPQRRSACAHELGSFKQRACQPLQDATARRLRPALRAPDLSPSGLDQLTVTDARGTDRLARAAIEALPHLLDEPSAAQIQMGFADRLDETNAAART